jgi:hypothetical protein
MHATPPPAAIPAATAIAAPATPASDASPSAPSYTYPRAAPISEACNPQISPTSAATSDGRPSASLPGPIHTAAVHNEDASQSNQPSPADIFLDPSRVLHAAVPPPFHGALSPPPGTPDAPPLRYSAGAPACSTPGEPSPGYIPGCAPLEYLEPPGRLSRELSPLDSPLPPPAHRHSALAGAGGGASVVDSEYGDDLILEARGYDGGAPVTPSGMAMQLTHRQVRDGLTLAQPPSMSPPPNAYAR